MNNGLSKTHANYAELINGYLNAIPVRERADVDTINNALEILCTENTITKNASPELRERLISLQKLIGAPMFPTNPPDFSAYRSIIRKEINAKINQLTALKREGLDDYIREQQKKRDLLDSALEKIAREAHALRNGESQRAQTNPQGLMPVTRQNAERLNVQGLRRVRRSPRIPC